MVIYSYGSGASGQASGYGSGTSGQVSGYGSGTFGQVSGYGSGAFGSNAGVAKQDANFARFLVALKGLKVDRSFHKFAWTANQRKKPKETLATRTVYPSSHVVQSSSGYQRFRDSSSYAKYSQDDFDHIDAKTGSKGQKLY